MSFQERKKKIVSAVNAAGSLSVFELSEKLSMSPATIRRDLNDISEEGLLIRTHGGAMKMDNPVLTSFADKSGANENNKETIGKMAADFVQDGDIIFLDCGSTVFKMCRHIKNRNGLKVITNSLPVLAELFDAPGISINLIGGEIDKQRRAVHGERAVQHIDQYQANKAFIGVDGISAEKGLTAHSEVEAMITSAFVRNADEILLLCDSSKIGKDSYFRFGSLALIHKLITDKDLGNQTTAALKEKGLDIVKG
ncbi:DeoR/GlpR transcriptional regulator [Dyadobacter flavalbus]|uniref:DeoR/GlpR transcriptional regulator n=1 Tax=Dyadobacter flavalbus TaxID=2579942 RepID=A0A5M8Q9X1_9BACT|nr:DeoR/GlpR family DNA-binding transcription regulator [Dyadobacter flavalbus]KAA6432755.1 DeoR/GlpR transcriptional regulator [Dyadobacter flavalbus]